MIILNMMFNPIEFFTISMNILLWIYIYDPTYKMELFLEIVKMSIIMHANYAIIE